MSDDEQETTAAVVEEDVSDVPSAIRVVLKRAMEVDGCIRGLHEVAKYIDAGKAQVVFLATSCTEPAYKTLVLGLCAEKSVPLCDVTDNKQLGEWAGLCKIDKDGQPRKVVGASCVCVTEFGEEGQAYDFLMKYLGKES